MSSTNLATHTRDDTETDLKHLGTYDLKIGLYRGSSGVGPSGHETLFERMAKNPTPYLRLYVMFPQKNLRDLERIRLATFNLDKLYENRLFITTKRVRGEMFWQLCSLYPGVGTFGSIVNHYTKGMRSGQIHRDTKAKQFRTSFGLVSNSFIVRAYQDFSGYAPFSHRALTVSFDFFEVPKTGVVALSKAPIKQFIHEALALRNRFPHLKIHQYPMKKLDNDSAIEAAKAAEAATPRHGRPLARAETPQLEVKSEPTPLPQVESRSDESVGSLLEEGDELCELLNKWCLKLREQTNWVPRLTTEVSETGDTELSLTLQRRYGK